MLNSWLLRLTITLGSLVPALGADFPGQNWATHDRQGWSEPLLVAARQYAAAKKTLAVMVIQNGQVVDQFGPVDKKIEIRSIRKSFLSAL